ncbi:MAG: hypothetical protein AB1521_08515 [Bacteroidota bacterium]
MKHLSIILFFTLTTISFSQQVYISKGYTGTGEPIDLAYNRKVEFNQSMCIILNNGKTNFPQNFIFLFIDIVTKSGRDNQLSKMIRPEKNSSWLLEKFKFVKEGNYEIYFTDFNRKKIASTSVSVAKKEKKKVEVLPEIKPELRIIFSRRIQNNNPFNVIDKVSMGRDGGEVYINIINNKPLNTNTLLLNIRRRSKTINDYDEFVDSKKFQINSGWNNTFFKYKFGKTGQYKINLLNEKELLIKTAYISVEN